MTRSGGITGILPVLALHWPSRCPPTLSVLRLLIPVPSICLVSRSRALFICRRSGDRLHFCAALLGVIFVGRKGWDAVE